MNYYLKIENINGFSCTYDFQQFVDTVPNSLIHTDVIQQQGIFLPLKNSLRFYNGLKNKYQFLSNNNRKFYQVDKDISALAMAGPYIAIGVKGFMGELITTYFMNIYEQENVKKLCYQKTRISKLAISPNGKYLLSLGEPDDKTQDFCVINTDQDFTVATRILYKKIAKGKQKIVDMVFSSTNSLMFGLLYADKLCFMRIDEQIGEVEQTLIKANRVREFHGLIFDEMDKFCYTASKNGDIAQIDIKKQKQVRVGPKKRVIISGIRFIKKIDSENILIIGQKGFIGVVQLIDMKIIKQVTLNEQITSISDFISGIAFISTKKAIIYRFYADTLEAKTFYVCLKQKINQITYPQSCPQTVVTCSANEITIWGVKELKPQLKITVPKTQCSSIAIDKFGKFIVSAWSDCSIRLFHAYNGKLMIKLENCHPGALTKVILDYNQTKIISGGEKGEIKVWDLNTKKLGHAMGSMSYHTKPVNQLKINPQRIQQMVCCSDDGMYSVWNLNSFDLIYVFRVCNFIKDCFFSDPFTLQLVGSGQWMYKVIKANGKIVGKIPLSNSHTNCLQSFNNPIENTMVLYGGQREYLTVINSTITTDQQYEVKVYSQVTSLKILPNNGSIIVGTTDGILLKVDMKERLIQQKKNDFESNQYSQLF